MFTLSEITSDVITTLVAAGTISLITQISRSACKFWKDLSGLPNIEFRLSQLKTLDGKYLYLQSLKHTTDRISSLEIINVVVWFGLLSMSRLNYTGESLWNHVAVSVTYIAIIGGIVVAFVLHRLKGSIDRKIDRIEESLIEELENPEFNPLRSSEHLTKFSRLRLEKTSKI